MIGKFTLTNTLKYLRNNYRIYRLSDSPAAFMTMQEAREMFTFTIDPTNDKSVNPAVFTYNSATTKVSVSKDTDILTILSQPDM